MKLNIDCVRDVLLCLEDLLKFGENLAYPSIKYEEILNYKTCKKYSKEEIVYTLQKLKEANYIEAIFAGSDMQILKVVVTSITFWGHDFLENIRNDSVYEEVKSKATKVGSFALDIIKQIAIIVITNRICQ